MNSWNSGAFSTCPHCGKKLANGNRARHARTCIHDPAVHALTLAAIDAGDGRGKTREDYSHTRGDAPGIKSLFGQLNTDSWAVVVEWFGLEFTRDHRQPEPTITMLEFGAPLPMSPARVTVCGLPVCRVCDYGDKVGFVLR